MDVPLKSKHVHTSPKSSAELSMSSFAERARVFSCDEYGKTCSSYVEHQAHLACHARAKYIAKVDSNTSDPPLLQNSRPFADLPDSQRIMSDDAHRDKSTALMESKEAILAPKRDSEFEDINNKRYEQYFFQPS
jgi:hypothetical protein